MSVPAVIKDPAFSGVVPPTATRDGAFRGNRGAPAEPGFQVVDSVVGRLNRRLCVSWPSPVRSDWFRLVQV